MKSSYADTFGNPFFKELEFTKGKMVNLTDSVISQIKENNLNVRQALVLLDMVKAEIQECLMS